MSDHHTRPRHHARKAAARQLQQRYPWLRYTDAYAASTPHAHSWRTFADSSGWATVTWCASEVTQAATLLAAAAEHCPETADRDSRLKGVLFAYWLAVRLTEVGAYTEIVQATTPLVGGSLQPSSAAPPFPGPLHTHTGLEAATLKLTNASRAASVIHATPGAPTQARDAAQHVEALRAWITNRQRN